ncbi:MAG TPA: hypothetical protein VKB79_25750 [Bryobacteraceae bacterium]|nr:hypothetical protein [Bryobacteraceae bacterium]
MNHVTALAFVSLIAWRADASVCEALTNLAMQGTHVTGPPDRVD